MTECVAIDHRDVLIIERVIDISPFAPSSHDAHPPQHSQLMRNGRKAHPQGLGQVAHGAFPFGQASEKSQARGISQRAKEVSKDLGGLFVQGVYIHFAMLDELNNFSYIQ